MAEPAAQIKPTQRGLATGPGALKRIRQDGLEASIAFDALSDTQLRAAYYRLQALHGSTPAMDYVSLLAMVAKYALEIAPGRNCC